MAARNAELGISKQVYFVRQTVGNACGTIGLLHALLNNAEVLPPGETLLIPNAIEARASQLSQLSAC